MKGVELAGGLGTRLRPLTWVTNNHLLPVYDKPMIYYPVETLVNAGVRDIMIVTGGNSAGDFLKLLRNGRDFGLRHLNYAYQEGEGGIAAALDLCRVVRIEEKPETPKSDYAVIGVYMYDAEVFDIIKTLKPSGRGELEITDVNNAYIGRGEMTWDELEGWWTDAGTFESLLRASNLVAETGANKLEDAAKAQTAETAQAG